MKDAKYSKSRQAFTLMELAVVLAVTSVLGLLTLGTASRVKAKSDRLRCADNLKNIGLGIRNQTAGESLRTIYETARNTPGTNIHLPAGQLVQALFPQTTPTKLWICPADSRKPAADWASIRNENLSYFLPLDPPDLTPYVVLGGDRNVALNGVPLPTGVADISKGTLSFTDSLHRRVGSLAMGDGSIQSTAGIQLRLTNENRVVVP
jgi:prepilin-type N-terminal cleavage/methylation domain-containing protein